LQRVLYRSAEQQPHRRFHALFDKVARSDVLERAWDEVRANRGAFGADGVTVGDVEAYGVAAFFEDLAAALRSGTYRPAPLRRVHVPKPGQPGKTRPLGIPTVRDRVVMTAAKLVLEPIFEADFLPSSYGFPPEALSPPGMRRPPGRGQPRPRLGDGCRRARLLWVHRSRRTHGPGGQAGQ
jgi:retron-type reverse transcriptase